MKKNKIIKIEMNEKVGRPLVRSLRAGFYGGGVGGSVADAAQLQTGGVTFQASRIYIAAAAAAATAAAAAAAAAAILPVCRHSFETVMTQLAPGCNSPPTPHPLPAPFRGQTLSIRSR